jgi:hypothetical protein
MGSFKLVLYQISNRIIYSLNSFIASIIVGEVSFLPVKSIAVRFSY